MMSSSLFKAWLRGWRVMLMWLALALVDWMLRSFAVALSAQHAWIVCILVMGTILPLVCYGVFTLFYPDCEPDKTHCDEADPTTCLAGGATIPSGDRQCPECQWTYETPSSMP